MRIFHRGVFGVVLLGVACLSMPVADAVSVQGGEVGEGTNKTIKTFVVNMRAGGNAAATGINNIQTFPANSYIIGVKLIATAANANCDLYDATSVITADSNVIDELAEINSNGSAVQMWPNPYKIKTALSVGGRNAVCLIYYY